MSQHPARRLTMPDGKLMQDADERRRILDDLLQANHDSFGLLYNTVLHNHTQHILSAAYQLGSSEDHLRSLYRHEAEEGGLVSWAGRPTGRLASEEQVVQHLGDLQYERDFVDYFADELRQHNGDWVAVLQYYLLGSARPLLTGLIGGYAHPFILLADAVELSSPALAMDALALTAVDYGALTKLLEAPEPPAGGKPPLEVLEALRQDKSFDGAVEKPGIQNLSTMLRSQSTVQALLGYAGLLNVSADADEGDDASLLQLVELAVHLLTTTHVSGTPAFDFYLSHNLTFCNCLRILLPVFPTEEKRVLSRMHRLLTVLAYVTQKRPKIKPELLEQTECELGWADIRKVCIGEGERRQANEHFIKAINILDTFAQRWPDRDTFFLKAGNKLIKELTDWVGLGQPGEVALDV